jgi:Cu2+-exporting ATPase
MVASIPVSEAPAGGAQSATKCFHCGLPIPSGVFYPVAIDGSERPMCCRGCQAVARAIVEAGLAEFYRYRSEPSRQAEELVPAQLRDLQLYDRPDLQQSFVRSAGEHYREASLILEGIVCAACVWLSERHVSSLPGVREFRVNYSTHRAHLQWDERQIRLSEVFAAIAAIGYKAHPFDPNRQESLQKQERAMALRRLAVAGLGAMQVMMLAVALYAGDYRGMEESIRRFLRWISLLITVPVIAYSALPFFKAAWRDLGLRRPGMDVPVSLAIAVAFTISAWHTWRGGGEVYFDSVTMFTFFLLSSRFLEMNARHRAGRISEEWARLLPATATRLAANGSEESVAVAELVRGDKVLIRPGAVVPADGQILAGSSSVDESLLTGESMPVLKSRGEPLVGGSVNVESPLTMQVEKVGSETLLSAIARLLDRAQTEKPRVAMLADRIAAWFVSGVLLIASVVAFWWWQHDPDRLLSTTLAVLVVTCPCALSLATPTAVTAATASLTRIGLLATRGHALETLARATHVVFDKTGTLTYGQPRLIAVKTVGDADKRRCLEVAGALEKGSEHPVGQVLRKTASSVLQADKLQNTPGKGIEGEVEGVRYRLGKPQFVTAFSRTSLGPEKHDPGVSWVVLGDEEKLLAWFELADTLRPDAMDAVAQLRAMGLEVILLSGDQPATVASVAGRLGIRNAEGGLLPEDKLARLKELQARGAVVTMVGDGINDAPVLAAAQVSIAMGTGAAIAHASADLVLISEHLNTLVQGFGKARLTLRIIRENLIWAVVYNLVALPLAAVGWIAPWMAALGMSLSSLLVVANALRLKAAQLVSSGH